MAKTRKKKAAPVKVGRQAPTGAWTPDQLMSIFDNLTDEELIETAKGAGILDAKGKLTPLYTRSWGKKISRALDLDG